MAASGEGQKSFQLTNFMELSPSWEATSGLAAQEFSQIFMEPEG
jgi:hypothetical protein